MKKIIIKEYDKHTMFEAQFSDEAYRRWATFLDGTGIREWISNPAADWHQSGASIKEFTLETWAKISGPTKF